MRVDRQFTRRGHCGDPQNFRDASRLGQLRLEDTEKSVIDDARSGLLVLARSRSRARLLGWAWHRQLGHGEAAVVRGHHSQAVRLALEQYAVEPVAPAACARGEQHRAHGAGQPLEQGGGDPWHPFGPVLG